MSEGGISAGTLTVKIVSDAGNLSKDVERQVDKATKTSVGALDKSGRTVSAKAKTIGNAATLALTAPIAVGAKYAIDAASDVVESTNKVNVVFEKNGAQVVAWSDTMAKSFGISKREALDAAGTFGNLFRAMGIGAGASADLAEHLTELAGDMASFNNANPEDVLLALRSGLTGETEPLRKFGINLNQSRIEAEAFSLGLVKAKKNQDAIKASSERVSLAQLDYNKAVKAHGKDSEEARKAQLALKSAQDGLNKATKGAVPEMTAAQKAQATYSLIMKDTKLQQGDFARSLGSSAANQQRVNAALADNAKAAVGQQLLPAYHKMLVELGKVAGAFASMGPAGQKTVVALAIGLAALGPTIRVVQNVQTAIKGVGKVVGPATRSAGQLAGGFRNVNKAYADNASLSTRLGAAIRSQAQATLQQVRATTASVVAAVRQRVATIASTVASKAAAAAAKAWAIAQRLLNLALAGNPIVLVALALVALVVGLIEAYRHSETFRKIVQAAFAAIRRVVVVAVNVVKQVITTTWRVLRTVFMVYFNIYKTIVMTVFRIIEAVVRTAVNVVRTVITVAWRLIRTVFMLYFNAYKLIVMTVFRIIVAVVTTAINAVRAVISAVLSAIRAVWSAGWNAMRSLVTGIWDAITGICSSAIGKVKGLVDDLVGFFTGLPGRMAGIFSGMFDGISEAFKSAVNFVIRGWNGLQFKIPGFDPPGPGPKFGGFTLGMPDIPLLARGGHTWTPGAVIVGDAGPEILELPSGATVTPLDGAERKRSGNTINVHPAPGMDELGLARLVDRELEWAGT